MTEMDELIATENRPKTMVTQEMADEWRDYIAALRLHVERGYKARLMGRTFDRTCVPKPPAWMVVHYEEGRDRWQSLAQCVPAEEKGVYYLPTARHQCWRGTFSRRGITISKTFKTYAEAIAWRRESLAKENRRR